MLSVRKAPARRTASGWKDSFVGSEELNHGFLVQSYHAQDSPPFTQSLRPNS